MNNLILILGLMMIFVIMIIQVYQFIEQQIAKQEIDRIFQSNDQTFSDCLKDSSKTYSQCQELLQK